MSTSFEELRARIRSKADEQLGEGLTARSMAALRWCLYSIAVSNGVDVLCRGDPRTWGDLEESLALLHDHFAGEVLELRHLYETWLKGAMIDEAARQWLLREFVLSAGEGHDAT